MHVASCTALAMPSRRIMGYCMGRGRCVGELVRCVRDCSYSYGWLTNISPVVVTAVLVLHIACVEARGVTSEVKNFMGLEICR